MARRWVVRSFGAALEAGELERAVIITSELVTNAVVHGHGTVVLRGELSEDRLLIEVIDEGDGFERTVREHDFETVGGWGLTIVDAEAGRWGIHGAKTHVWFEVERRGPRLGPSTTSPAGGESET